MEEVTRKSLKLSAEWPQSSALAQCESLSASTVDANSPEKTKR